MVYNICKTRAREAAAKDQPLMLYPQPKRVACSGVVKYSVL